MRTPVFLFLLFILLLMLGLVVAAPYIGLGSDYDFILWRYYGLRRGLAVSYPAAVIYLLCIYQALSLGVPGTPQTRRFFNTCTQAWREGADIWRGFTAAAVPGQAQPWLVCALIFAGAACAFAIFLNKTLALFALGIDQHWHQALIDYDTNWRTPFFSLAGNVLNQFGIQLPLKTKLIPLEGLASLAPVQYHIVTSICLIFIAMCGLFWGVGHAIGLRPVARSIFASAVGLLTTVPQGLDVFVWLVPPNFITSQFSLALWWQEAPILAFATVLAFYWIGQSLSLARNIVAAAIFAAGCFETILGYPTGGVYFIPIIAFYCLGLFVTAAGHREMIWKGAVGAIILVAMLVLRVPQYFSGMYEYTFGAFFSESTRMPTAELFRVNFIVTVHGVDLRGAVVFAASFAALVVAAIYGKGGMRRFAIAALVGEAGIVAAGTFNAVVTRSPLGFGYAEIATAPMWISYFVLLLMIVAVLIERRLVAGMTGFQSAHPWAAPQWIIEWRRGIALAVLILAFALYGLIARKETHFSHYPPDRPVGERVIESEVRLLPGNPYSGTVFTLIQPDAAWGDPKTIFDVIAGSYRQNLGNDFLIDLPAFDIPTIYQHAHWTSPVTFAFLRSFFGRQTDPFSKAFFSLRSYDPKIARLMGVRIVVTDDKAFADGVLIHEEIAGSSPLRIFRIDGINLGQYSPTRPNRVDSAAGAVAALKRPDFDPTRDVVVEDDIAQGLVAADSASLVTDYGPALVVRGASKGRSLLVLPFEYSHCLRLDALASSNARLVPVNLQQIGLMFDNDVEARITYRFGLLKDAACRGEDIARAERLKLREIVSWPQ